MELAGMDLSWAPFRVEEGLCRCQEPGAIVYRKG